MKKNAHYVGVDDKYIPEEEKYVDDTKSIKNIRKYNIGYLVFMGIMLTIVISIFIFVFITMFRII